MNMFYVIVCSNPLNSEPHFFGQIRVVVESQPELQSVKDIFNYATSLETLEIFENPLVHITSMV